MNLHLYKLVDMGNCDMDNGNDVLDAVRVMTEKELRKEFLWALDNGNIPEQLIVDYQTNPDYKNENWKDMSNLRVGTMIDMLNDICNYECGTGYYILETDVEVELNLAMVDRWLDVLNYWDDEVRDAAERTNKMPMYNEYDTVINDIYRMKKGV